MKVNKKLIHDIVTFINTISEKYNITNSIGYSLKRWGHVDIFVHYYKDDALIDTIFVSVNKKNFVEYKKHILHRLSDLHDKYNNGTKS